MIGNSLRAMKPAWFATGLALMAIQLLLASLRWQRLADGCDISMKIASALRFTYIGQFFSQSLPAVVGADGARIWFLGRTSGNWKGASYSVVIDRSIGGLALGLLVLAILPGAFNRITDPTGRLSLILVGLVCMTAFATVIGIGIFPFLDRWGATRHARAITRISGSILRQPRTALTVAGCSLAVHLASICAVFCIARALSAPLALLDALFLVPPVLLITTVPISVAGWGVRESAMVAALAYAGLTASQGLLISILFGLFALLLGLVGGVLWISSDRK